MVAETDGKEAKSKAMAILSTMVGALTLSRVVNDRDLAQAFLDAAVEQVRETVAARKNGRRRRALYRPRSSKRRSLSSAARD
jgi:TetR/AcrR family transcriptional repressor of nem operon